MVEYYTQNGITDWQTVWLIFAGYSLVLAFAFVALFNINMFAFRRVLNPSRINSCPISQAG
ncbi:nucleoside permease [Salmonella enterica subsp. arizonae]|uniref:Nucleoside permease n=1 Tax=Salmonella enterica subsp. arizonae TaxID=59203 RepID=A0A447QYL7_SALER|nr:nucleoside permease [Salmonella enterica subsp. arizonae]